MSPEISLLLPCYNSGRHLPRLAESIRGQTAPFAEIICYDDGSTDDTAAVARSLGFMVLTGSPNRGPAFARNRLLEAASKEWVHFHDADDLLQPDFVEKMSGLLGPNIDVAVCNMDWRREDSGEIEVAWRYDAETLARDPVAANVRLPIGVIACVLRRDAVRRVGGFDETLPTWEDAEFQVRLAASGARYRLLPEVLSVGLRRSDGASADLIALTECHLRVLQLYARRLPARYAPVIAAEAENLASIVLADRTLPDVAGSCLELCRSLGWRVPSGGKPALLRLRGFLPARTLLAWQSRYRQWRKKRNE